MNVSRRHFAGPPSTLFPDGERLMKKTMLALLLGALVASTAATAGPFQQDEHRDQQEEHHDRQQEEHHDRAVGHDEHRDVVQHDRGMHEGWYRKGAAVPQEYRDHRYVVDNWHEYHLREPPRGYQWVRSDNGEFLLIAVTSGVIADIMLSH